jgi:hypothetical protein
VSIAPAAVAADPRALLRELEWCAADFAECPLCGWPKESGHHHPTCRLAAALRDEPADEPLVPAEVVNLAVPLEHVLEQLQHAGPNGACPLLCNPTEFGQHADLCPLGIILAALPGRTGGSYLSVRRRNRSVPQGWPMPALTADGLTVGSQAKVIAEIEAGTVVCVRLKEASFGTFGGTEIGHRIHDLALVGDELWLQLGARTRQVGYLTPEERREARRATTTKKG